ncbi:MAG: hypothetical protein ACYDCM_13160 [Candidatus Acidiferrales bacterium]
MAIRNSSIFCALLFVIFVPSASAQYNAGIDVTKCYAAVLQHSEIWENNEDVHYRLMTYMSKEDYETLTANGKASAFINGIPVNASFDVARAQATKLIQLRDEELLRTRHTYSAVVGLDQQATAVFRDCVKGMVDSNPYGIFYYVTHTDPATAQLELEWRWIEGRKLKIRESTIDGGYMLNSDGTKRRSLYLPTDKNPTITQGQNFIVKFDDPNKDINISIVTDPQIRYWPIVIYHLSLRKKCVTNWLTTENDLPLTRSIQFDPAVNLTGQHKGGGDGFSHSQKVEGVITNVTCDKFGQTHIELDLANGASVAQGYGIGTNEATCAGWLNANPKSVIMTYSWKKDQTRCDVEEPWPMDDPKWKSVNWW